MVRSAGSSAGGRGADLVRATLYVVLTLHIVVVTRPALVRKLLDLRPHAKEVG